MRRGKVEKSSTFLFQKKLNLRYYLPRLTLGTMDTNVVRIPFFFVVLCQPNVSCLPEIKDCCLCFGQGRLFGQVGFVCRLVCLPKVPDLQRWLIGEGQPCTKTHVAVIMCPQGKVAIKNIIQSRHILFVGVNHKRKTKAFSYGNVFSH